jgi:hypothetical protein
LVIGIVTIGTPRTAPPQSGAADELAERIARECDEVSADQPQEDARHPKNLSGRVARRGGRRSQSPHGGHSNGMVNTAEV